MPHEITIRMPRRFKQVILESVTGATLPDTSRATNPADPQGIYLGGEEWLQIQAKLAQQEKQLAQLSLENARLKKAHADLEELLKQIDVAVTSLARNQRQRLEEAQHVAIELALAVAESICARSVREDNFDIAATVKKILEELGSTEGVTIYLHPADRRLLEARLQATPDVLDQRNIRLVDDPTLARGSCRAESNDADLLSTIEDRLADIKEHLLNALPSLEVDRRVNLDQQGEIRRYPERRETA